MDPIALEQFNALASYLADLGLGDLFSTTADGTPGGWLWDQIVNGIDTEAQLVVALEATPQFQQRYGIIKELRQRAAAGEPIQVPSVGMVRQYEVQVSSMMRAAGLPAWFYDSYEDTHNLMRQNLSPVEIEQRIAQGWDVVRNADPAVRNAFTQFYGVAQGDAALAAFMLDPTKTVSKIEQASRAAYTAGYGQRLGLEIEKSVAEQAAALPTSLAGLQESLTQTSRLSSVATEGITETQDITTGDIFRGIGLGEQQSTAAIERRLLERQANERASSGGAAMTQAGLTGVRVV